MDFWLVGTNPNITGDEEEVPPVFTYYLEQNYPNPFNPITTIKFGLREKGRVTISIYNVAGRLVRILVDEIMDAGAHSKDWDSRNNRGSSIASGVYFYRMKTKNYSKTKKIVLLR